MSSPIVRSICAAHTGGPPASFFSAALLGRIVFDSWKRRFASADMADTKADETAMLVDPAARLGDNGVYARAAR